MSYLKPGCDLPGGLGGSDPLFAKARPPHFDLQKKVWGSNFDPLFWQCGQCHKRGSKLDHCKQLVGLIRFISSFVQQLTVDTKFQVVLL